MPGAISVNTGDLRAAGEALKTVASDLSALNPDAPLSDAAGVGASLKTADACRSASTLIATQNTGAANQLTEFSSGVSNAAAAYDHQDQTAAADIDSVHPGR